MLNILDRHSVKRDKYLGLSKLSRSFTGTDAVLQLRLNPSILYTSSIGYRFHRDKNGLDNPLLADNYLESSFSALAKMGDALVENAPHTRRLRCLYKRLVDSN